MGNITNRKDLNTLIRSMRELSTAYKRTGETMTGSAQEMKSARDLWARGRGGSMPPLVKFGLALIAFPDPTISDAVGFCMVGFGLAYSKVKPPPIYVEDVYGAVEKEMSEIGKALRDQG